jgi:hypothetical protein
MLRLGFLISTEQSVQVGHKCQTEINTPKQGIIVCDVKFGEVAIPNYSSIFQVLCPVDIVTQRILSVVMQKSWTDIVTEGIMHFHIKEYVQKEMSILSSSLDAISHYALIGSHY